MKRTIPIKMLQALPSLTHGTKLCPKTKSLVKRCIVAIGKGDACRVLGLSRMTIDKIDKDLPPPTETLGQCKQFKPEEELTFPDGTIPKKRDRRNVRLARSLPNDLQELILVLALKHFTDRTPIHINEFTKEVGEAALEELGYVYHPSPSSLWRVMRGLGFFWSLLSQKPDIYSKLNLVEWRAKYLEAVEKYKNMGAFFTHLDETWVYQGMAEAHGWNIKGLNPVTTQAQGYAHCFPAPATHGKRAIVLSAISEKGVIPGSTYTTLGGRQEDGDYHKTMNGAMFEEYFATLLPKLAQFTDSRTIVIVFDNAKYHLRTKFGKEHKKPKNKAEYKRFLDIYSDVVKYGPKDTNKVLKQLIEMVIEEKKLDIPIVGDLCNQASEQLGREFVLLRLPPYHSMLNAIELLWARVKADVRKYAPPDATIDKLMELTKLYCEQCSPTAAKSYFGHVEKEEDRFRALYDAGTPTFPIQIDGNVVREEINAPNDFESDDENSDFDEEE